MKEITVDLDYPTILQVLKTYVYLEKIGDVKFRRSSSKGFHFKVEVDDFEFEERLKLRFLAGDDLNRITMDSFRNKIDDSLPTEVLWDKKDGKESGEWLDSFRDLELVLSSIVEENPVQTRKASLLRSPSECVECIPPSLSGDKRWYNE